MTQYIYINCLQNLQDEHELDVSLISSITLFCVSFIFFPFTAYHLNVIIMQLYLCPTANLL